MVFRCHEPPHQRRKLQLTIKDLGELERVSLSKICCSFFFFLFYRKNKYSYSELIWLIRRRLQPFLARAYKKLNLYSIDDVWLRFFLSELQTFLAALVRWLIDRCNLKILFSELNKTSMTQIRFKCYGTASRVGHRSSIARSLGIAGNWIRMKQAFPHPSKRTILVHRKCMRCWCMRIRHDCSLGAPFVKS